jgi:hypothetical protein
LHHLKKTTLSLPFFDDFTGYDVYPDPNRWVDKQVYINNTMCINPVSRGVATFDALNEKGLPWDPYINVTPRRADSLTCQPIDLSTYTPGDSLYLSFFYQPQGYGFRPLRADSLLLMVRVKYGDWVTIWKAAGAATTAFRQVMVPITDTLLFYSAFQFRFVNIASLNYADAIWNVDYVRMGANRSMADTAINDIAIRFWILSVDDWIHYTNLVHIGVQPISTGPAHIFKTFACVILKPHILYENVSFKRHLWATGKMRLGC